ncbi:MAG: 50S ribosomal protein L6 [Clostridiales bacterium]|nr:50S ribosomal protein L6 [Clostridiales bacterium]
MSRIGRLPVAIPAGVTVEYKDNIVTVKGPKGTLSQEIADRNINVKIEGAEVHVERTREDKSVKSKHGLYRQLISNMVAGVVTPFSRSLIVNGVGWKAAVSGKKLTLNVGYSHPVDFNIPEGINITCPDQNTIVVSGISKELVGQTAATIKSKRPVEPYHSYGIRYSDEVVIMKEGKKGK